MKTLSLIHGWGIGSCAWQTLTAQLGTSFKLQIIDLPGYGKNPGRNDSFLETAQNIANSIPPDNIVCGWSLGGIIAMQLALLAPQRIAGLIAIAASPCFTKRDDWPQAQPPALLDRFDEALADDAAATLKRFIALFNQGDRQARTITRTLSKALAAEALPDGATLARGLDWLRRVDLRAQLSAIAQPALVIHGEADPLMPLASARWLAAALPQARLEVFSGAAHAPFLNDRERFARLLGDFCDAPAPR